MGIRHIDNRELTAMQAAEQSFCLLDVRTRMEYEVLGHIPNAQLIPVEEIPNRAAELDPAATTVVICQHGVRSAHVAYYLVDLGFSDVLNHQYGMAAWDGPVAFGPVSKEVE